MHLPDRGPPDLSDWLVDNPRLWHRPDPDRIRRDSDEFFRTIHARRVVFDGHGEPVYGEAVPMTRGDGPWIDADAERFYYTLVVRSPDKHLLGQKLIVAMHPWNAGFYATADFVGPDHHGNVDPDHAPRDTGKLLTAKLQRQVKVDRVYTPRLQLSTEGALCFGICDRFDEACAAIVNSEDYRFLQENMAKGQLNLHTGATGDQRSSYDLSVLRSSDTGHTVLQQCADEVNKAIYLAMAGPVTRKGTAGATVQSFDDPTGRRVRDQLRIVYFDLALGIVRRYLQHEKQLKDTLDALRQRIERHFRERSSTTQKPDEANDGEPDPFAGD